MDSTKTNVESAVDVPEKSAGGKTAVSYIASRARQQGGWGKGVGILDFILRICALVATLAAAISMGTTDETLPFFTQFSQFQASYDDLPTFSFFVVAMAIASGYLVLSLPFSMVGIIRPRATAIKLLLLILDMVVMAFVTAAGAAAAAIVYLAHNGNSSTNWLAICQQFNDFCKKVSGAVVASFIATVIFILLIALSAIALRRCV